MIARDGNAVSLWQSTTSAFSSTRQFINKEFDVIVVGGGITGMTTAVLLQKAGMSCVLLEAKTLCFGSSGGTTAHLNTLLDTPYSDIIRNFGEENARLVANYTKAAIELIENNIAAYQIECDFSRTSAYLFAEDKKQEKQLDEIQASCEKVGVETNFLTKIPWPFQFSKALEISGQAKFHPTRYVIALAKAFEEMGGLILENCRVRDADYKEIILIDTPSGKIYGHHLVYATHIPPGITHLNLRCAPYRSYAIAFPVDGDYPDSLAYDMYDPYHYYRTQMIDGKNYLIVGGEDHKTGHERLSEDPFKTLEEKVKKHFNVQTVSNRWSSQYFESVDGLPFIGKLNSSKASIHAASGFGGNGMIYGTISALLFHDILHEIENPCIALFSPKRHKILASAKSFIRENVDTASQIVNKFWPAKALKSKDDLELHEGGIFRADGQTLAFYRNGKDSFYAIDPACSHMKCQVTWNGIEKSWDCPCHGARYSVKGEVLTGPADTSLKRPEAVHVKEKRSN